MTLGAELLTAKPHRGFAIAQRTAALQAPGRGAGPHAGLLALQRKAGNRAVAEMLGHGKGAQVQREIGVRPGDLAQHERMFTISAGTYGKIVEMLRGFHRETDARKRLELADALRGLSEQWMANHPSPKKSREASQFRLLERLEAEASREASKLRAEAIYLGSFPGVAKKGTKGKLGGVKSMFKAGYAEAAIDMKAGKSTSGTGGTGEASQELAAKYKLSTAEVTAIRTFTMPDYMYINPAVANSESWLRDNIGASKDPYYEKFKPRPMANGTLGPEFNALKLEGALHGGMLMQAVLKLPAFADVAYRGTRETPAEFKRKYREGAKLPPYTTFSSASRVRANAQGFADGTAGNFTPPKDRTVSVVFVLVMNNGRDISKLSAVSKEAEVLILPGAVFKVDRVVQMPKGAAGSPPANDWYTVFLSQER